MNSRLGVILSLFIVLTLVGGTTAAFAQHPTSISPEWSFLLNGIALSATVSPNSKCVAIAYVPAEELSYSSLEKMNSKLLLMNVSGKVLWEKSVKGLVSSLTFSKEGNLIGVISGEYSKGTVTLFLTVYSLSGSLLFSEKIGSVTPAKGLGSYGSPYLGIWRISHEKELVPLPLGPYSALWRFYRPSVGYLSKLYVLEKQKVILFPIGEYLYEYSLSGKKLGEVKVPGEISGVTVSPEENYLGISVMNGNYSAGYLMLYSLPSLSLKLSKKLSFSPLGISSCNDRIVVAGVKRSGGEYSVEAIAYYYSGSEIWSFSSPGITSALSTVVFSLQSSENGSYSMISISSFSPSSPATLSNSYQQIWILNSEGKAIWHSSGHGTLVYGTLAKSGEFFALENLTPSGGMKISLLDMTAKIRWSFETVGSTLGPLGTCLQIAPDASYLISVVSWASQISTNGSKGIWGVTAIYFFSNLAKLSVQSYPRATVYINGVKKGESPITLYLPPGTYKVTLVRKGYYTVTQNVTLGPLEYKVISVRLWNVIYPMDYVAIGAMVTLAVIGGIAAWHYEKRKHEKL